MSRFFAAILATLSLAACEAPLDLEGREFEIKMISRGNNAPPVDLTALHGDRVLVLAREGADESALRALRFADGVDAGATLDVLLEHGFIERRNAGVLSPTVAVMTLASVQAGMPVERSVIEETVAAIRAYAPSAFDAVAGLDGFSHLRRDQYDLFLLSNGLLDNFQIANVEAQVIASPRPSRAGGNYYLSVQEKAPGSPKEAFAIYGNHTGSYGAYILGVYGNQRNERTNFHRMGEALFADTGPRDSEAIRDRRAELVAALAAIWRGEEVEAKDRQTLERLGFVSPSGVLTIPVLTVANYAQFSAVIASFTATLTGILGQHLPRLRSHYEASPFAGEVSFEEYFIWWFHLYYSAVTDALVAEGLIHVPAQGVTTYLMIPEGEGA